MKKLFLILLTGILSAPFSLVAQDNIFDFKKTASILIDAKGQKTKLRIEDKKYILVYYSSHWCSACKSFTPKLVDFYKKNSNGLFEIIFMSLDFSEKDQLAYMRNSRMPWIAVSFPKLKGSGLFEFAGYVMPWIAVFKVDGTHIPNSNLNLVNRTPEQVLAALRGAMSIKKNKIDKDTVKKTQTKRDIVSL